MLSLRFAVPIGLILGYLAEDNVYTIMFERNR